jgi:hypothetical protein
VSGQRTYGSSPVPDICVVIREGTEQPIIEACQNKKCQWMRAPHLKDQTMTASVKNVETVLSFGLMELSYLWGNGLSCYAG